jgi:hypothetical protein
MAGLQEGMSKVPEPTDDDTFLEFAADYAERACEAEFGRFVTALRAKAPAYFIDASKGTDSEIKASVHDALLKKMRERLGLSPSPLSAQPGSQQAI